MPIHVVGPNDGEQSGGGPIRCRIIEDGSHTQHRLGMGDIGEKTQANFGNRNRSRTTAGGIPLVATRLQ